MHKHKWVNAHERFSQVDFGNKIHWKTVHFKRKCQWCGKEKRRTRTIQLYYPHFFEMHKSL